MTTRIELIDDCYLSLGQEPLQSEDAPGADGALRIWKRVMKPLLGYPWFFNTITRQLSRRTEKPTHWEFAFDLPSDMNGAPRAYFDQPDFRRPFTQLELKNRQVHTNAPEIWITFTVAEPQAGEEFIWPAYFEALAFTALRSEYALFLREDRALRNELREEAFGMPSEGGKGGLYGQAMTEDNMARPSAIIADGVNPLIAARG